MIKIILGDIFPQCSALINPVYINVETGDANGLVFIKPDDLPFSIDADIRFLSMQAAGGVIGDILNLHGVHSVRLG